MAELKIDYPHSCIFLGGGKNCLFAISLLISSESQNSIVLIALNLPIWTLKELISLDFFFNSLAFFKDQEVLDWQVLLKLMSEYPLQTV